MQNRRLLLLTGLAFLALAGALALMLHDPAPVQTAIEEPLALKP